MTDISKELPKLTKLLKKAGYFDQYKRDDVLIEMSKFFRDINKIFLDICRFGLVEDVKFIYKLAKNAKIPIKIDEDFMWAFESRCNDYNLDFIQFLYQISIDQNQKIDINQNNDFFFRQVCEYEETETAKWLLFINNKSPYYLLTRGGKILKWNVNYDIVC